MDREHQQGRSLAASNWRRLGISKGRGRDDRQRQKLKTPKDVWVYELDQPARRPLQAHQVQPLAPRSLFSPLSAAGWVEEEMGAVDLGDQRLNRRAGRMLAGRWARPQNSF